MGYKIHAQNYKLTSSSNSIWQRRELPSPLGECLIESMSIESGVNIFYSKFTPTKDLVEQSFRESTNTTLTFAFSVRGTSVYQPNKLSSQMIFKQGNSSLSASNRVSGKRYFRKNEITEQFRILVHQDAFERYNIPALTNPRPEHALRYFEKSISPVTMGRLKQLNHLRCGYIKAKPLEYKILVCQLLSEEITSLLASPPERATTSIEERLVETFELMQNHIASPLTIEFLARQSCMGVTTFKDHFKKMFDKTPYQALIELRMIKAVELLNQKYPINKVASLVGYQHASNFCTAFQRFYGYSPKTVYSKR